MAHPLKLDALRQIANWEPLTQITYKNSVCTEAEQIYQANLLRMHGLTGIPGFTFFYGEDWKKACFEAERKNPNLDANSIEFSKIASAIFIDNALQYTEETYNAHYAAATLNAELMCSRTSTMYDAYYAFLQSIIVQAWTAFEVLAGDLHRDALAKHPTLFSSNQLSKKYGFQRQDSLFDAYAFAFGKDFDIQAAVENAQVKSLALLRHLIVHKNGKVDPKHLKQRAEAPIITCFDSYGLDAVIPIDGEMIRSLVDPVTERGYALLKAVDKWITTKTT